MAEPVKRGFIGTTAAATGAGVSNGVLGGLTGVIGGGTIGGLSGGAILGVLAGMVGLVGGLAVGGVGSLTSTVPILNMLPDGAIAVASSAGSFAALGGAAVGGFFGALSGAFYGGVGGSIVGAVRGVFVKLGAIRDESRLADGLGQSQQLQRMQENAMIHDQIAASAAQQGYNQGLQDAQMAMAAQIERAAQQQAEPNTNFVETGNHFRQKEAARRGTTPQELEMAQSLAEKARASREAANSAQFGIGGAA